MGGPEADGGNGQEDILAWLYDHRTSEAEGHADGVARKDLAGGRGAVSAEVAVEERRETKKAFNDANGDDGFEVV